MALTPDDVAKIARLARLQLDGAEQAAMLGELNDIFALIEKMQAVDTDGVEAMAHPHETLPRLRDDAVTGHDRAAEFQACAPDVRQRLYIVPQVIES
ncbi:Asp-tRNA(Asn)/Glu-tRNA(Gln) amidotransferase subunit GatC [Conchiformibius kuhniae]|uniref:Aspartyl/glutamyl-tRNA(Asn/Gln) amidotransferase subunit C n=1 Tax=Conchiformibius kuhniae TaxID=211502 RepID=A0A8T9MSG0_9NEIS|nr:Asp-tRNA(Asn)/Glu-tRNA(Gln) amidotransferase subunit GatC [Conchiformibius kuhniae]UOP04840.1 Asp-tRNA(Asn)/Glu-tRNA(Gln) amidotransferase subunit GatC [Conchiformibius kuhniae]